MCKEHVYVWQEGGYLCAVLCACLRILCIYYVPTIHILCYIMQGCTVREEFRQARPHVSLNILILALISNDYVVL